MLCSPRVKLVVDNPDVQVNWREDEADSTQLYITVQTRPEERSRTREAQQPTPRLTRWAHEETAQDSICRTSFTTSPLNTRVESFNFSGQRKRRRSVSKAGNSEGAQTSRQKVAGACNDNPSEPRQSPGQSSSSVPPANGARSGEDEEEEPGSDFARRFPSNKGQQGSSTSLSHDEERIPILLSKVEKAMDCRIEEVEENMVQWKQAPYRFWLLPGHSTPAQWSFECLQQGRHDGLRRAFHMLNLATDLNSRKQKDESKKMYSRHIDAMMEEWPDHPTLDATAKRNRRKTLRLYLDHGTSLQKLWKLSAGLIFLVAPTLRDVDYTLLDKHWTNFEAAWRRQDILDRAAKYREVATVLLACASRRQDVRAANVRPPIASDGVSARATNATSASGSHLNEHGHGPGSPVLPSLSCQTSPRPSEQLRSFTPAASLSTERQLPRPNPQRGVERNIANATTASVGGNPRQVTFEPQQDHDQDLAAQRDNLLRQDLVAGEEQAAGSHSPAHDTRPSSFQSDSFASTPSTTESQQSQTLNRINYEVVEQPVASAQDLNRSCNLQPGTNQSEQGMSSRLLVRERQQQSEEFIPYFTQDAGLISTVSISAAPFADNEFFSLPNCNDVQGFFSDCSRVMRSPSPPQVLLVAEELFHNIKVYFEDSCQNMTFDDHGTLLNPNGAELHNELCNEFDSYCFTATMFKGRELHVEFRHALSKASALVEQILRAEHPRTLACFLEVFIHLIQTGLPEVTSILRGFIKKMSEKVTRGGHPWGQICRLLGELDSEPLDQAMAQIWKCTTDTFESQLGASSRLAVSVRLDYIKRVYGFKENLNEERLLRDLLAQFDGIPRVPTPRVMLNLAHNLNRQGRHNEAEKMAREVFSLLQQNEIYAKRIAERIECMKIVSHSQFNQGKTVIVERTIREAIQMIVYHWGIQHAWVLEFMNVLEGWLRDWGREEDANTLRGEIEWLMGKGEADEQLDGIQGLLC